MENLMHIGNRLDEKSRVTLSRLIQAVLSSGFENHSSEAVQIKALDICREIYEVKNVTVTGCMFEGGEGKKKGGKK
jgi:hypothetical protein